MHSRKAVLLLAFLLAGPALGLAQNALSPEDLAKIRMVHKKYEETWLSGDADGVRALFTDDSVLLPPHAAKPWIGQKGLNEFWFPPSAPPTKITKLVLTLENIGGDAQIAYAWGTHEVAWTTTQGGTTTSASHKGTSSTFCANNPTAIGKSPTICGTTPFPRANGFCFSHLIGSCSLTKDGNRKKKTKRLQAIERAKVRARAAEGVGAVGSR